MVLKMEEEDYKTATRSVQQGKNSAKLRLKFCQMIKNASKSTNTNLVYYDTPLIDKVDHKQEPLCKIRTSSKIFHTYFSLSKNY